MRKSRLFGMSCYVCGSMDRTPDGGVGWRNYITPLLNKLGIIVLDPCNKPVQGEGIEDSKIRKQIEIYKQNGEFDKVKEVIKPIRQSDLRLVDKSDFIIVNLDLDMYPCGTYEELFWANRQKKPVLIRMEGGKAAVPHWLYACFPHEHMFENWDELISYLTNVANNTDQRTFKRWVFFDMEGPTSKMLEVLSHEEV
jgi:nucleoside 2-deoxyribosyltransferase